MGYRKAVYRPFPQAVPNYPVIDRPNCTFFQKGTCKACEKFCPTGAIKFDQQDEMITVKVGNIILATGYDLFDARRIPQYGYGRLPNVFTSLEFERLSNAAGPTGGKIVLRDGVTVPKSVGIIHCVGSRDKNYNNYCSAICCMQSLKFAHLVQEKTGAEVLQLLHRHPHAGQGLRRVLPARPGRRHALHPRQGGRGDRYAPHARGGRQADRPGRGHADRASSGASRSTWSILSAGLRAARTTPRKSAIKFGISCSADHWFIEKHPKLDPVATMTDGVFVAGACQGPKDIPASVAQGSAAAARVLSIIGQKEIEIEAATAIVDEDVVRRLQGVHRLLPLPGHRVPGGQAEGLRARGAVQGLRHLCRAPACRSRSPEAFHR